MKLITIVQKQVYVSEVTWLPRGLENLKNPLSVATCFNQL
jgi:ribosome biogenesis protein Nip4